MTEALRALEERLDAHSERIGVRFQDVDAAGIVFYARTFDYFHDAYAAALREHGAPLEDALREGSWVAPLRRAEAEYLRPLRFGDQAEVSLAVTRLEETEYEVGYRIRVGGKTASLGRTLHVSVDPATFRRAPLPPGLRSALQALTVGERS